MDKFKIENGKFLKNGKPLPKKRISKQSGVKGVYYHSIGRGWQVSIYVKGKTYKGGFFKDLSKAIKKAEEIRANHPVKNLFKITF